MLKIEKVNKYFNRHKKNEIHVINNTSFTSDSKGLIALLGPSGCGKTTLLNAIGGLDKINKGKIYINGKKISTKITSKRDKIRVLNISYIFQNYNLLENLTVYENIALSLKMIGIKNKNEIKRRVDYVLEKVGMYRYRNKLAGNLSGGQKQRVGIARAIVKNPAIIIADEPTGNLDSKNTIEVMNIIKSISKDKLVILVTHEKDLAHFYASRIVNLEDGKVASDKINDHENELDYRIDNKIYLKDFKHHNTIENTEHKLDVYSDNKTKLDLDIIIKNGNIYIKSNNLNKLEIVDEYSNIELIDDHYKKISKEDYEKSNFDLNELDNSKSRIHYSSIYNIFQMIQVGIKKVFGYSFMKKILLIGFFISAMFIVYAISNIFGITNIKDSNFLTMHRDYIQIENNGNNVDEVLKLENNEKISYIIPGNSNINLSLTNLGIYQLKQVRLNIETSLASIKLINKSDIVRGTLPKASNEIVIDVMGLDKALTNQEFKMANIKSYDDFLEKTVTTQNNLKFIISGIVDTKSPSVYMYEENFVNVLSGSSEENNTYMEDVETNQSSVKDYNLYKDDITIKNGNAPLNDYEVIVNISNKDTMPLNKNIDIKVNEQKLKVVGYYYSKTGNNSYYVNNNTIKYDNIKNKKGMMIYSINKDEMINQLRKEGYNGVDVYASKREKYIKESKEMIIQSLIIAGILLAISFIEIFLMIRASFLSRIKEVGIYRAIGAKKSDIYKMFLGEILVITTLAGVPGFILMTLILKEFGKISYLRDLYMINSTVLIISIILIYGLNIIVGLLPIKTILRKTPAEILARNDVD